MGAKRYSVSLPNCLQQWFWKLCWNKNYTKLYPSHNSQLNPKIVHTPENYKIINRFINSAEDSTHVIFKNDQNEDADHPKIEIWYNVNNYKGLQNSRYK